ncbi:methionine aminopeptidase 1B [Hibiscus syriacus]|uniref:Methionine aminopeptidase 1B n=1 Tax=Hibiscus syriacus TaxID=106335 RepID=A0A6A3BLZ1_HIBSY|nr:methionine aminopeptidase 1B [Hibiscus syriacus]
MDGSSIDESTTSDSVSNVTPLPKLTKSPSLYRHGSGASVIVDSESGVEAESKKLPSSKYKGVRLRFRGRDAVTNFKHLHKTEEEDDIQIAFLNSHSKAEIVDMLRKHTYNDELEQSRRSYAFDGNGKRIVKKDGGFGSFGYSYWNSSQSYVLTKGWSRFVKERTSKPVTLLTSRDQPGRRSSCTLTGSRGPVGFGKPGCTRPNGPAIRVNIFKIPGSENVSAGGCNGKRTRNGAFRIRVQQETKGN